MVIGVIMSDKMKLLSKEVLDISKPEDILIEKIQKEIFWDILETHGFDYEKLKVIFESEIYTNETQNNLNLLLREMKTTDGILLSDSVIFLEEFTRIKKILVFLDGESKYMIKTELSDRHNIEIETNNLSKMIG